MINADSTSDVANREIHVRSHYLQLQFALKLHCNFPKIYYSLSYSSNNTPSETTSTEFRKSVDVLITVIVHQPFVQTF